MDMFPCLSHRILRHKQRAISVSFRGFSLAQGLRSGCDAGVVRAAGEHARSAFRGGSSRGVVRSMRVTTTGVQ